MARALALALALALLAACGPTRPELAPLEEVPLRLDAPTVIALEGPARPVAHVTLDDAEPVPFLVDTGAETTVIDRARAEALGLPLWDYAWESSIDGAGAGSTSYTHYAHVTRLRLGALEAGPFRVTVLEDPILERHGFAGVLGQDVLARLTLVLDSERSRLHLLPAGGDPSALAEYLGREGLGAGSWIVQPTSFRPRPFLPLHVEGLPEGSLEMLVDTGADGTSFPQVMLDVLGAEPLRSTTLSGIGGDYESEVYALQDFDLLGFRVSSEVHRTPLEHGVLGMNVLREFVLLVDGPGERVWLHHRAVTPRAADDGAAAAPGDDDDDG